MPVQTAQPSLFSKLRNLVPVLLGLGLFAVGIWALEHLLRPVNAADVIAQMKAMPVLVLIISVGATALGYIALIGYDWWALVYLDKRLPVRAVALGGFLGYSFGNTIGISVISGGAVRYRIYSAFGLNAFDVAALATYIAVAMGMGLMLVGLLALGIHPEALAGVLPFSLPVIQVGALLIAFIIMALTLALSFSRRSMRIGKAEIAMPAPRILLGQLGVAIFDSTMAALALYVLLPVGAPDFAPFIAIYAAAAMVAILSHVPGGVGVFETVVIAAMPQGVSVGEVAAALLVFRMIYFLLPFALAFAIVSLNEARMAGGLASRVFGELPEPMRPVVAALSGAVPWLVGLWALGFGAYLVAIGLMPSVIPTDDESDLISAILLEGGTLVSAVTGIVLIILSHGLVRRISGAYWFTLVAICGGGVASLLNHFDFESALILALGALALLPFRREFHRRAKITEGVFSLEWFALIAAVLIAGFSFFFFVHEATPYSHALWTELTRNANTSRALRAGLAGSAVLLVFSVYLALRPARARRAEPEVEALDHAARIIASQDDPQACLALSGDKSLMFSSDEQAFVMYGRHRANWVAFGDPVGPPETVDDLAWNFHDEALRAGGKPVFYEVSERHLPLWIEMGMVLHKVGEEAVVRLADFSLGGAKFKSMRAAFNKAKREGYELEILQPPHSPALMAELAAVSEAWLGGKTGREKGFSVGRFDPAYLEHFPIAAIRNGLEGQDRVIAFANILAPGTKRRVSVDLMRYLPEHSSGIMEFLFVSLIEHYRNAGGEEFSLGMAPLAGLSKRRTARIWDRFGHLMFRHGGSFYNFEGLRNFKQKFHPEWRPRYIALPPAVSPMVAMADIALLISGGPRGIIGK